jgi:hypothetical protein
MKTTWYAGAILASALALAACNQGGGGNTAAGNASGAAATNQAAPAAGGAGNNSSGESAGGEEGATPAQPAAGGAQQDFAIVNSTGQAVMTLNVSPSDDENWGPDILGRDVLPNGERADIQFARGQDQCNWDIRVTYENGGTGAWQGINLCETATVTLE